MTSRLNIMETITPFTVSRGIIFKTLLVTPSTGWPIWAVLFVGLVLLAFGCFFDLRYFVFGIIVCCTIVPTIALFRFVNFMLGSEMVANLLNHTVERRPTSYLIHIFRPADKTNPVEEDKTWVESGRLTIFEHNVVKRSFTRDYEVLFLKESPLTILYVPRN